MAWIEIIGKDEAKGMLKKLYADAIKRAGRIWNIVSIMSRNPRVLKTSMDFYGALMFGPSPLSRGQREMLATVVSGKNHCGY
jgi:alkylhydroperoxidase family enzyme